MTASSPFDQLYEDYFDYAFRLARFFGAPHGCEEDVAQEVFFSLFEAMKDKRFVAVSSPRPWLRTAVFRRVRDFQRGAFHRHRAARDVGADLASVASVQENAEGLVGVAEDAALLLKLLDVLDTSRRAVFVLHEIMGHTLAEVARDLGIPESTAATRLRLAREDLAAALHRHQVTEARTVRRAYLVPVTVEALVAAVQTCSLAVAIPVPLGARARVWARLQEQIRSLPDGAPALDPSSVPPRLRFNGSGYAAASGAGFAAGVAATLLLVVLSRHREAPQPSPVNERAPIVAVAPTEPAYVPAVLPVQTPTATAATATPPASSAAPQANDDAEAHAERRCLGAARAALDATPPDRHRARAVLAECAQRFPMSRHPAQRARLQEEADAEPPTSHR